jgi:hypothetical protein
MVNCSNGLALAPLPNQVFGLVDDLNSLAISANARADGSILERRLAALWRLTVASSERDRMSLIASLEYAETARVGRLVWSRAGQSLVARAANIA